MLGIDMDSWYRHGLMVLKKTHGIDLDSYYWEHPWYWLRLMVENRYSWITHVREGRVLPVCGIFFCITSRATPGLLITHYAKEQTEKCMIIHANTERLNNSLVLCIMRRRKNRWNHHYIFSHSTLCLVKFCHDLIIIS